MTVSSERLLKWLGAVALTLAACGGGPEPTPTDTTGGEAEAFEETGSMRALADDEEAPDIPDAPAIGAGHVVAGDLSSLNPRSAPPPANTREIYRRLAPSTVIVRAGTSMGTGVLVGDGLVLTNNHVIAPARRDAFRMRATVEYGNIGEAGSMIPDGERRTAYVLKRDEERDLALLRVEEPLAGRPSVSLSAQEPTPGDTVITLGHGNIGMVWAIRRCEVEATGRLEETYSRLAAVCGSEDERAAQMCQTMRERMHNDMHGLVVQSSCPLAPGDSGGPLVDPSGALVGVNVMTIRNIQGQHSNYHIHVREVRDFLLQVPTEPLVEVPTPWIEQQGFEAQDQDLDGHFDTAVLRGRDVVVSLIDLDQDTPEGGFDALERHADGHGFDAEVAVVVRAPHRFIWYDTNNDGSLDLILSLDERQRVEAAHTIRGTTITEAEVPPGLGLSSARVSTSVRDRFNRIFNSHTSDNPDPMPALLRRGEISDADSDGAMDTVHGRQMLVHAVAFDVDQDSTRGVTQDGVDAFVRDDRMDAEFTMVYRDPTLFTYYDRDNDGHFDTGFRHAPNSSVVAAVVPIPGVSEVLNTNDVVGTLGIRGDWFGERAGALVAMAIPNVVDSWIAYPEDRSALPDPVGHHRSHRFVASYTQDGWEDFVLRTASDGYVTTMVDVDRSSWRGRNRRFRDDLTAAVRDDHFSAEFGAIYTQAAFWAYYDRNQDGEWDLCLVRVNDGNRILHNAFVRDGDAWVHDDELMEGPPVRPELLRRRHRARFATMAHAYFADDFVTPAEE